MDDADVTTAKLLHGVRRAVLAITVVALLVLGLPMLWQSIAVYRWPVLQFGAFGLLVCVVAVTGLLMRSDRFRYRWALLAAVCAAWTVNVVDIAPLALPPAAMWSTGPSGWFVLMLFLDRELRVVLTALGTQFAVGAAAFVVLGRPDHAPIGDILLMVAITTGYQIGVVLVAALLRHIATTQAKAAREEERLRTAAAVADELHRDRLRRYAELGALPLLAGLAAGVLDPADRRVRTSCAVEAARMRRLFAERDDVPDPLLHELRACADTAERKGVTVYLGTWGCYPSPPLPVRRALTEPAIALVATAASHARVTVIGSATGVTVSVVTDCTQWILPSVPTSADVTTTHRVSGDRLWMEATWRTAE